jgi:flagellar biosynthesis chaperone FliJ
MTDRDMDNQLQDVQKSVENFVDDLRGLISDLRGERDEQDEVVSDYEKQVESLQDDLDDVERDRDYYKDLSERFETESLEAKSELEALVNKVY